MEAIKLSKKFKDICYEIMDGSSESVSKLDAFSDEFMHQVMAVKAAVAFFDMDYENAINLVEGIMPYWDEWYYSNVCNEYMAAMAFASKETGQEDRVKEIIKAEQNRLLSNDKEKCEAGKHQRYNYCNLMLKYIDTGVMPKTENEVNYTVPESAKSVDEIMASKKLKNATVADKKKLYSLVCMLGKPEDAIKIYEEIKDETLSETDYENAVIRYLYFKDDEKALEAIERLASMRMWTVAASTQVRPMNFFTHPMMHKFLKDEKSLTRIKEAAFKDLGIVKRK